MTSQTDEKGRPMTYWGGKTDELKPCAWCGTSSPEYDNCDHGSGQWYSCRGCPVVIKVGYNEDLNAAWNTHIEQPCPHVFTSKGGTSHCTLAASEIDRHLAEIDRLKRQVEVLASYTRHKNNCPISNEYLGFTGGTKCVCGLDVIKDKIEKE